MRPRSALLIGAALLLAGALSACQSRTQSGYVYDWSIFWRSLFSPSSRILGGVGLTVGIAVTAQIIGVILGVFGALGRLSKVVPLRILANIYVWIFRGTPLLVQIMFLYYGLLITRIYPWPDISLLGITISSEIQAGVFALGVNEGAYMTEIRRASIRSSCSSPVPSGSSY